MSSYTIIKNNSILIDLASDIADQGWTISAGIASHSGCNSGYIEKSFDLSSGTQWTFKYIIPSITTGNMNIVVGGQEGISRTVPGLYEETFTVTGNNVLVRFFSTGVNSLELLQVFAPSQTKGGRTIMFNEDGDKWVGDISANPEMMCKFIGDFFMFDEGRMWVCNSDLVPRNNFFGTQYPSKITFYVNLSPTEVKNYFSMRQKSTALWTAANDGDIFLFPSEGKPDGQSSRLKSGRFRRLNGDWFADFLRDLNDPRFSTTAEALTKGALLQGNVMKITLENNDTTEVRLLSVDIEVGPQNYTY